MCGGQPDYVGNSGRPVLSRNGDPRGEGSSVGGRYGPCRDHHSWACGATQRQCDHIARHQISGPDAQIEPLGNDINKTAFGHKVNLHLGIVAQK